MAAELVHGTRAMYRRGGCRQECCRAAQRAYDKRRRALLARGLTSMVDAAPVRAHVLWLGGYGIGPETVAARAGVSKAAVAQLLYGVPSNGKGLSQKVRRSTAQALLSVQRSVDNLADSARTPGGETRVRLRELVAAGWTQAELAERLDVKVPHLYKHLVGRFEGVSGRFARQVRDLHAELAGQVPPRSTTREKARYGQALAVARKRGWTEQVAS